MKSLLVSATLITLMACGNKTTTEETNSEPIQASQQEPQYPPPPADTGAANPTINSRHESVFPLGKFSSVEEMKNNCFSNGSTKIEVRKVQGKPDYTKSVPPLENWYYGTSIVQFKGALVSSVNNSDGSLKYVDYFALALSPDKVEGDFYLLLNSRVNR